MDNAELFYRLDEAMADPKTIEEDTEIVGGYVSGLDLIYTDEEVVERAIEIIKSQKKHPLK